MFFRWICDLISHDPDALRRRIPGSLRGEPRTNYVFFRFEGGCGIPLGRGVRLRLLLHDRIKRVRISSIGLRRPTRGGTLGGSADGVWVVRYRVHNALPHNELLPVKIHPLRLGGAYLLRRKNLGNDPRGSAVRFGSREGNNRLERFAPWV
jgi:hypothetical protein